MQQAVLPCYLLSTWSDVNWRPKWWCLRVWSQISQRNLWLDERCDFSDVLIFPLFPITSPVPCSSGCPLRSLLSKPSPELPVSALSPQLGIVMLTPWCLSPCGVRGREDGWGKRKGKQAEWTAVPGLEGSSKTAEVGRVLKQLEKIAEESWWKGWEGSGVQGTKE